MYGKKRIVFGRDKTVTFAGGGSWSPRGWWEKVEGGIEARMLTEEYRYTRPTAPHMYQKFFGKTRKDLKAQFVEAYGLEGDG